MRRDYYIWVGGVMDVASPVVQRAPRNASSISRAAVPFPRFDNAIGIVRDHLLIGMQKAELPWVKSAVRGLVAASASSDD